MVINEGDVILVERVPVYYRPDAPAAIQSEKRIVEVDRSGRKTLVRWSDKWFVYEGVVFVERPAASRSLPSH